MKKSIGAKALIVPTPVWVVGTYDPDDKPNVMTAAWGGICCSKPPCVGVSLRKARYSYDNIVARKAFTVNVPSEQYVRETDYFGIASGRKKDKFAASGLTPVKSDLVDARFMEAGEKQVAEKLDMLGRLLGATRLMDMYLKQENQVAPFAEDFLAGRYHFASVDMDD